MIIFLLVWMSSLTLFLMALAYRFFAKESMDNEFDDWTRLELQRLQRRRREVDSADWWKRGKREEND